MSDASKTCNDAVLVLLKEKLQDILRIEEHTVSDLSHICVEKEILQQIKKETEGQILLLEKFLNEPRSASVGS